MRFFLKFLVVFALVFFSCSHGPERGGDAFPDVERKLSIQDEISFGNYMDEIIMSRYLLYPNEKVQKAVSEIGAELARFIPLDLPYRFKVIISIEPNSFSAPGGYVYVTTGLLDILSSRCEVAAAIARELAHIYFGDQIEMYKEKVKREGTSEVFSSILNVARSRLPGAQVRGAKILISSVASMVMGSGYTKDMDIRADRFGMRLLKRAGYDPNCMISYLHKLLEASESFPSTDIMGSSRKHLRERLKRLEKQDY